MAEPSKVILDKKVRKTSTKGSPTPKNGEGVVSEPTFDLPRTRTGKILKPGYIEDFISGDPVKEGPEEVEATQVITRRLVDEYDWPRDNFQTRPQFRVKERPSDESKYPVDVAVFKGPAKSAAPSDVYAIVECKRKSRKSGVDQLHIYLTLAPSARLGIWYNGQEQPVVLWKNFDRDGSPKIEILPVIPRWGEDPASLTRPKVKELHPPVDLVKTFKEIRNYLAGMATSISRDEALARQMKIIGLLKVHDELNTSPDTMVRVGVAANETGGQLAERLQEYFAEVKGEYETLFDEGDALLLDPESLRFVVGQLNQLAITQAPRDALVQAFEVFIGPATRGTEGQFHTPTNAVRAIIDILDPQPDEVFLDDACGGGTFLVEALKHVWRRLEEQALQESWSQQRLGAQKVKYVDRYLRGIEKDSFLARTAASALTLYTSTTGSGIVGKVHIANSLLPPDEWSSELRKDVKLSRCNVLGVNPPYGSKIRVVGEGTLKQYDMAHRWSKSGDMIFTRGSLLEEQAPQLLFLERNIQFLKEGGRMGIVLLESIFGMPKYAHVVDWLLQHAEVYAIISMPEELFQPHTHAKTCLVFIRKTSRPRDDYPIFMAVAKWCGHDSMGRPINRDDLPGIVERYRALRDIVEDENFDPNEAAAVQPDNLGFITMRAALTERILIPKYYAPEIVKRLRQLETTHDLVTFAQLNAKLATDKHGGVRYRTDSEGEVKLDDEGNPVPLPAVEWWVGHEPGKLEYGLGKIPFIRTSDITNWELKYDPKQNLSDEAYLKYKKAQDVRARDIFLVRDGTYLVGTSCILTPRDTRIVFCGGLYKIRVNDAWLDPYLLLAVLNTPIVKEQIKAKKFTRDVIDTLGHRIGEVVLPFPKDPEVRRHIARETKRIVLLRTRLREQARHVALGVTGAANLPLTEEDVEELGTI